ncbi:MAG TPA: HAD family hydrolase [Candidatus Binatia bacterium]|nr:HAD family hydrolase [Candidatus Binatia bacterium]
MRYLALACDYDGTLASDGQVSSGTLAALERLLASGRKLILVTGRELDDLFSVFPRYDIFEWVVAENGVLLYHPATGEKKSLASPPPAKFVARLRERGVPISIGDIIVSTRHPYETLVLDTIRELGLELQLIFNKGAVMILPSGTSKATGLAAALKEMGLSPHNVVAVGDAENDHALLALCECSVAVANALPMLQEKADFVTAHANGRGAAELINEIIAGDLRDRDTTLTRHHLLLGTEADGRQVRISPFASNILLAGSADHDRRNLATAFIETLGKQRYQFCVLDPRGAFEGAPDTIVLGRHKRAPTVDEIIRLLKDPVENAIINMSGVGLRQRSSFVQELFARLQQLRARIGHPHWIIVDEAQDVLSRSWQPAPLDIPQQLEGMMCVTGNPAAVARFIWSGVNIVLALDASGAAAFSQLPGLSHDGMFEIPRVTTNAGEAIIWLRDAGRPFRIKLALGKNSGHSSRSAGATMSQRID